MSIIQRRPAIRTRREQRRSQRYREVCAELERMRRMHEEGCYEAYPKLRQANEDLIHFAESICDFFAEEAPACIRIAAHFRIAGNTDLADQFTERSETMSRLAEKGYQLLIQTAHFVSTPPE